LPMCFNWMMFSSNAIPFSFPCFTKTKKQIHDRQKAVNLQQAYGLECVLASDFMLSSMLFPDPADY